MKSTLAPDRPRRAAPATTDSASPSPLGATVLSGGVNFSVFSRSASAIDLLLFDRDDDAQPSRVVTIDPIHQRQYHYWHVFVPGLRA